MKSEEDMNSKTIKYPDIEVQLSGIDGNAISIIGKVSSALKKGGIERSVVNEFADEAMSGDYNNVIQTCMKWVRVK